MPFCVPNFWRAYFSLSSSTDLLTLPKPPIFFAGAAFLAAPTCPKPRRATPMPNLSVSASHLSGLAVEPNPPRGGETGVGAAMFEASAALGFVIAAVSAASASGSYPSFSMRSASSFALRSASSKSKPPSAGTTFLAPRPFFFAPKMFFLGAAPAVVFRTVGLMTAGVFVSAATSGDLGRSAPLPATPPGFRKGDWARGVPVREGGFEGRLMVGLSHEEKKSSSSPAGVLPSLVPATSGTSVITTSSG